MLEFLIGLGVGLVLGAAAGIFLLAMAITAADADNQIEAMHAYQDWPDEE